ncbi:MAG: acetyl-CoA carboxylase biotin carboxylase subunit [Candidatus Omnitrophica bacterium]|nr:acetyl-CoA carboxylase biotin carboxylase subunit [Candidatus Omnitrophota bacterium]MCM8793179.1 acetyl-CoA carboxylase biotin carboxylase subunit [Candidatus Omnitrophota bacterium]
MFSKILIANRGEIALRIIRACKEMGIRTVAVYSEIDADSLHTKFADESICIGPANPQASYLHIPSIISAAEITDAEAIHPGYGFLSENAHFAEICQSCGITFIGPSSENIRLMGDKLAAKEIMRKAGIPVVPGSPGVTKDKEEALKIAQQIKYPVIIKSAGGGGGKGMRICHSDVRLVSALLTCQAESEASFGKADVYIEKYIPRARHIEIQILADKYGRVIYLGERECSIQRRYQKLIEESPSPALTPKLRRKLGELAVKGAKAINYNNLGTMEFLMDEEGNFYFMEMNTRLQVEHPVTEMVTGIDIVKEQIKLAAGEKLSIKQDDLKLNGWAIECRVNAEDPDNNFLPSPGRIDTYITPGGRGVRIDSHIYAGYVVPPNYDPLLAKLIVYGKTRIEAIKIMQRALEEFAIEPIKTTITFHRKVFSTPEFIEGNFSTDFVNKLLGLEGE